MVSPCQAIIRLLELCCIILQAWVNRFTKCTTQAARFEFFKSFEPAFAMPHDQVRKTAAGLDLFRGRFDQAFHVSYSEERAQLTVARMVIAISC